MNRDGLGVREPERSARDAGAEGLAVRLAHVERSFGELLERLQRYERERVEIRTRLGLLLERLGCRFNDG